MNEIVYLIAVMCWGFLAVSLVGKLTKAKIVGESPSGEAVLIMAYMLYGWFVIEALNQVIP